MYGSFQLLGTLDFGWLARETGGCALFGPHFGLLDSTSALAAQVRELISYFYAISY